MAKAHVRKGGYLGLAQKRILLSGPIAEPEYHFDHPLLSIQEPGAHPCIPEFVGDSYVAVLHLGIAVLFNLVCFPFPHLCSYLLVKGDVLK